MSLKPQPNRVPVSEPVAPSWGLVADAGENVTVVRFETPTGAHTFPYHTLTRWTLSSANDELRIHAGREVVTLRGRDLGVLRDALDEGRLKLVRPAPARYESLRTGAAVRSIELEESAA